MLPCNDIIACYFFAGCFITGLEYSADVKAEVVGKPEAKFFLSALARLNEMFHTNISPEGKEIFINDVTHI